MVNRFMTQGVLALVAAFVVFVLVPMPASAQPGSTPWGDPDLQGIWTNFDLGEGFNLETPPPPGVRASRLLIGTGICIPSDEPLPESGGGVGIGPPEHWFETSKFADDADDTLWLSGSTEAVGWLNTRLYDETGDERSAQGWCPTVIDTNGDGVITKPWNEPTKDGEVEIDPSRDTRVGSLDKFQRAYGVIPHPDGSGLDLEALPGTWAAHPCGTR